MTILIAGVVALVLAGCGLAWAIVSAPASFRTGVACGGGVAAAVIIVAVTVAARYAGIARSSRTRESVADIELGQIEREFAQLTGETLPVLVRWLREGAAPEAVLAGIPRPESAAVRGLLETVVEEVSSAEHRSALAAEHRAAEEGELAQLCGETLPGMIEKIRSGEAADLVLSAAPRPSGTSMGQLLDTVIDNVTAAERRGSAAMAACATAAARIQAQSTRMLAELREMENRHGGDEKIMADLMALDHRVSQMGRLADSIALLAGGRSGRRWTKPIAMESILRGAMGRIDAYQRVRLHSTSTAAVAGYAAEGVMHALAELMDNAAAFSAHGSEVHVYVEEEDAGVVVTIEDSGLGMRRRERSRAEGLVSRSHDLASLPGSRLGLAVVGRVASRYGLNVNFRPSARGGTGVVMMIPRQLVTQVRIEAEPLSSGYGSDAAKAKAIPSSGTAPQAPEPDDYDPDNLPVRPRGRTLETASTPERRPAPARKQQSQDAGSRFAAFRNAGERNRTGSEPEATT